MSETKGPAARFSLGALAPPLHVQLKGALPRSDLRHFDKDGKAIVRLRVRGYLADRVADELGNKLAHRITHEIRMRSR